MKKVEIIDIKRNHFEELGEIILPYYKKDPMNFLFIGPSGDYVKQIAESVARKVDKTINRDAFRVINQYAVEIFRKYEPSFLFIDRDFLKSYIAKEMEDLIEKEKNNPQFKNYVKTLSKSKRSIDYLLEIFERKWEISRIDDENIISSNELYSEIDKDVDGDSNLYKLYKHLEEKLEEILNTKFDNSKSIDKNYDQISIYKWFYNELPKLEKTLGNTLFISGFFDIPPILTKVLKTMFNMFDNVIFFAWNPIDEESFKSLERILYFLKNESFEINYQKSELKKLFKDIYIQKTVFKNTVLEIENVAKEIKRKIIYENNQPQDFGIIVPDTQTANAFAEFFEELNVPYRLKNDIPLSESVIVSKLLLPLKAKYSGYEVEDLLALIEAGYGGERSLSIDEIESLLKTINLYYDYPKSTLKSRKEKWLNTISKYLKEIKAELNISDEKERLEKQEEQFNELFELMNTLFNLLEKIDINDFEITYYRELLNSWINEGIINIKNIEKVESELNALYKFHELLLTLEKNLSRLIDGEIKLSKFYNILSSLIETEKFRISERYSNTVEIFTLNDSRFVHKKYKIFVSFTDRNYPSIAVNPLLSQITQTNNYSKISELQFRENLYISMLFSDNVIFTYPKATLSGEEILSSPYEKDFEKLFKVKDWDLKIKGEEIIPADTYEIFSLEQAALYFAYNNLKSDIKEINSVITEIEDLKVKRDNYNWMLNDEINTGDISHNKISTYVDCPFKYYLKYLANIKGNKDFSIFYTGNLKHRIMKRLFDKYPAYNSIFSLIQNEDILYNEIKEIAMEEWDNSGVEELRSYKIVKEIEIEDIASEMVIVVKKLVESYIFFGSSRVKNNQDKKTILYNKVLKSEYSVSGRYKDYNFFARIDRIDLLEEDIRFGMDKKKDELKPVEKIEKEALSIIDYKNSKSFQSEQLLFYYYILLNNPDWKSKIKGKSIFLSFLPMKEKELGKKDSLKWMKIEDNDIYIKYPGNSTSYSKTPLKEFEKWFDDVIKAIKSAEFYPAFIDDKNKLKYRFLDYLRMKEYNVQNSSEKYYTCDGGYNSNGKDNKCEYYRLCSVLGWGKYINLKTREHVKFKKNSK
ncbi:hypothetical protein X275_06830 [Marinitoga sp. 1197]|uniref:PD-(D/E)XK nuclease family protein n=1 Tax=Marinitoga sp. 1197 TaxID=1428449 RepID=UPI000640D80F|nr:PD-(D/E)XK nuclease family protein [Marinitoga sp. 1197]KLO22085.1 hypothetical protein X275_06830 [Marinitoga sp. 1197]